MLFCFKNARRFYLFMPRLDSIENVYAKNFIYTLSERLMRHFDLEYETYKFDNYFHLSAYHRSDFNKSFLTRATVYEGFSVFEHILIRSVKNFDVEDFSSFKNMLINISPKLSNPNKFHKRSVITGLIISESSLDTELSKMVSKFFHRQNYKYCFNGWSETQMIVCSLADRVVYFPKNSKEFRKLFIDF